MLNRMNELSIIIVISNFGNNNHHEAKICLTYINYKERYCSSTPEACNLGFDQFELTPNSDNETSPFSGAGLNAFLKSL